MKLNNIMLYYDDLDSVIPFWVDILGFTLESDVVEGIRRIEITVNDGVNLVFFMKDDIRVVSPEVPLTTPSLMFFSIDLEKDHLHLQSNGILVGDIVTHGNQKVFNFRDLEENYFAITSQ
ncbi:VOC family protein [Erysipelothrix sp. HDW6C]|uniref:VOC family protein n=1 Tax=Erysipelothrix sp. HDW6C TaxID=2714930 RepID=UPI00140A66AE|nr:VOC family protein [Erysipelothrix sp. HDW6C]QIK69767.1 VOC family protein [Erysipelothrix sp. HDW6C]